MANTENLKPFKKGEDYRRNVSGRPRKYYSTLKAQGYSLSEVNDCIQVLISMNLDELKEVWENKQATILEKTIAGALKKSIEKGSLYSVETLLTRVYGKPKETVDQNVTGNFKITLNLKQPNGGE